MMEEVEDHFITDYFLASSWQLYTLKRNKLQYTDSWGCEAVYWSLFQGVHLFGRFFGTIPTFCEDMLDPISIFIHSLGRCLG